MDAENQLWQREADEFAQRYARTFHYPGLRLGNDLRKKKLRHLSQLPAKLDGKRTVFFDCFDTLVRRDVWPPDQVILESCEYANSILLNTKSGGNNLFELRSRITADLRKQLVAMDQDPEPRLIEIWRSTLEAFCGKIPQDLLHKIVDEEIRYDALHLEPMPGAIETLVQLKNLGCKIYILSDTYYDQKQLENILREKELLQYIEQVFSSSEIRRGKYSGRMFDYVLENSQCDKKDVIHIGDNPFSDYTRPMRTGLSALHFSNLSEKIRQFRGGRRTKRAGSFEPKPGYYPAEVTMPAAPAISQDLLAGEKTLFKIGFEKFGPVFQSFVDQIVLDLNKSDIQDVYFLARDGFVLKQIFDFVVKKRNLRYRSHYLFVSRASTTFLDPADISKKSFRNSIFYRPLAKLSDFKKLCGVGEVLDLPDPAEYGLSWETALGCIDDWAKLEQWGNAFAECKNVNLAYRENKNRLLNYLKGEGLFHSKNPVAFVDVGWNGTIQRSIAAILADRPEAPPIRGFYMGRSGNQGAEFFNERNRIYPGYIFDSGQYAGRPAPPIGIFALMEIAAGAPHGTTTGYKQSGDRIIPVLGDPDSSIAKSRHVQDGVVQYCISCEDLVQVNVSAERRSISATKQLLRWFKNPPREDAKAIADIRFDLGWHKTRTFNLVAGDLSRIQFIKEAARKGISAEIWKSGAMKYHGLPVAFIHAWKLSIKLRAMLR